MSKVITKDDYFPLRYTNSYYYYDADKARVHYLNILIMLL